MARRALVIGIIGVGLAGCAGGGFDAGSAANHSSDAAAGTPAAAVVAYVNNKPVTAADLRDALHEAAGGEVLAELILDRQLERRLESRGLSISDADLGREKQILLRTLAPRDPDHAVRLLRELRRRRRLGDGRFNAMLRRNAAMRALVSGEVSITDPAVRQGFDIQYGPRFEVRLIVVDSAADAATLATRARRGESFIDLAIKHSTDDSRAQGGLIAPISPADPTWPGGIRKVVTMMQPGQVSDPIALENGFAVVRLERQVPASAVQFEEVKDEVTQLVRLNVERILIGRLARTLLDEAEVLVINRQLKESWDAQRQQIEAQ